MDTSSSPAATEDDVVESPSLSSSNALARFEFEPGRSKDGTKVLMVEWEDDDTTRGLRGDWAVSWEGKRTVLPARDSQEGGINRLYFLLPGGERVPGTITLTLNPERETQKPVVWNTNPLPAIFPPELGASARESGKKGVLHTIWAKKRLQVLAQEIEIEGRRNAEGIALLMALQEREWIEQNFGVVTKPPGISIPTEKGNSMTSVGLASPTSPRSPGGGRLMEKLKGLKLGTTEKELGGNKSDDGDAGQGQSYMNPLSPEQSDVAVSSFGSFAALKGMPNVSTLAARSPQRPTKSTKKMAAQRPPDSILAQQRQAGVASLNAYAGGHTGFSGEVNDERGDDLFALPMSPRSPEMGKSPFSFGSEDTMRYIRGEKA